MSDSCCQLAETGHFFGEIRIETFEEAPSIIIRISDTGSGISEKNIKKMFDPFFTTKPVGKGTGLGLSIAHGIIEDHHGSIDVKSQLGKGTTFTIQLPIKLPIKGNSA